jgi:hypothetical protein
VTRYSASHTKAGVNTVDTVMWMLRPGSNDDMYVYEIGLSIQVAPTAGPMWRIARATGLGVTPVQATPVLEDPGATTANGRLDISWATLPTVAAQSAFSDLRRYTPTNAIGNGIVWTWYDKPLFVASGAGLCIVNGNAAGATLGSFHVYARLDE